MIITMRESILLETKKEAIKTREDEVDFMYSVQYWRRAQRLKGRDELGFKRAEYEAVKRRNELFRNEEKKDSKDSHARFKIFRAHFYFEAGEYEMAMDNLWDLINANEASEDDEAEINGVNDSGSIEDLGKLITKLWEEVK